MRLQLICKSGVTDNIVSWISLEPIPTSLWIGSTRFERGVGQVGKDETITYFDPFHSQCYSKRLYPIFEKSSLLNSNRKKPASLQQLRRLVIATAAVAAITCLPSLSSRRFPHGKTQ